MSAKIMQLLIILTLYSDHLIANKCLIHTFLKNLGHFEIFADSLILENQDIDTRVERIITMRIFEARYRETLALTLFFLFRNIKPGLFPSQKSNR